MVLLLGDDVIDGCEVFGGVPGVLPVDMSACRLAAAAAAAGVGGLLLLSSAFALEFGFFGVVFPDETPVTGDGGCLGDCGTLAGLGEVFLCAPAAICWTFCTDQPSVALPPACRGWLSSPNIPNRGLSAGPVGFLAVGFCTAHPPCGTLPCSSLFHVCLFISSIGMRTGSTLSIGREPGENARATSTLGVVRRCGPSEGEEPADNVGEVLLSPLFPSANFLSSAVASLRSCSLTSLSKIFSR